MFFFCLLKISADVLPLVGKILSRCISFGWCDSQLKYFFWLVRFSADVSFCLVRFSADVFLFVGGILSRSFSFVSRDYQLMFVF